jgi:hypothetical protein
MGAAVEDVHEGDGQNVGFLGPRKIGDVSIKRYSLKYCQS